MNSGGHSSRDFLWNISGTRGGICLGVGFSCGPYWRGLDLHFDIEEEDKISSIFGGNFWSIGGGYCIWVGGDRKHEVDAITHRCAGGLYLRFLWDG